MRAGVHIVWGCAHSWFHIFVGIALFIYFFISFTCCDLYVTCILFCVFGVSRTISYQKGILSLVNKWIKKDFYVACLLLLLFYLRNKHEAHHLLALNFFAATTLTGLHFITTTLMTAVLKWLGYIQPSHLPLPELLKFVLFANFSIVGMNVSLMWNSVGFYQVYSGCYVCLRLNSIVIIGKITSLI